MKKGNVKLMKRKYVALLLSGALALSLFNGCGNKELGESLETLAAGEQNTDAVYGEVSQMSENAISIKVGNRRKMEQPDGEAPEKPDQDDLTDQKANGRQMPQAESGELRSILDLTGEEQEIPLTKETLFQRQDMRGGPGGIENGATDDSGTTEEISSSDIVKGDVIMVTFAEDGSAKTVTVISPMGGSRDFGGRENDGSMPNDVPDNKQQGNETI